jgi:soluble lytic murein transglycosylase
MDTALAAYNAGWGNVRKWLRDEAYSADGRTLHTIPFKETENFVKRVNAATDKYRELYYGG